MTAIVLTAVIRIGRKSLKNEVMWALAAFAFIAIYFSKRPFPRSFSVPASSDFSGACFGNQDSDTGSKERSGSTVSVIGDDEESPPHAKPNLTRAFRVSVLWLTLWLTPTLIIGAMRGWESTLFKEGLFFSKAAVVTFGGAYAVLPYVAQQALFHYGWLKPGQMLDGLGLAETTPGPLIMVLQFVGFMGAWQHPEGLPPLVAATIGALITTWATFTPCFLWIFWVAPISNNCVATPD